MALPDDDLEARFNAICERIRDRSDVLSRLLDTLDAKDVYEAMHPDARRGAAPGLAGGGKAKTATVAGFVRTLARQTRRKERTAFLDVEIALGLSPETCTRLRDTPIAMQTTILHALSKLPPEKQREATDIYGKRRVSKGEVQAEKALKLVLKPAKAVEPTATVTELDEPLPIGGGALDASLLGHLVRFEVTAGRLRVKVLGVDQSLAGHAWPARAEKVQTTTGNWVIAMRHAHGVISETSRDAIEIGPIQVVPPTYCLACGESRFWIQRVLQRDLYLRDGTEPPFGWRIEGRSSRRPGDQRIVSTRRGQDGATWATVVENGERKEYRLLPRRGWPWRITEGPCTRCYPRAEGGLSRDLAATRHSVLITVAGVGQAKVKIGVTLWSSGWDAGTSYDSSDEAPVLLFEVEDDLWETFAFRAGGEPVFSSLAALSMTARTLFEDVVARANQAILHVG